MTNTLHSSHPDITARLRRAQGHLAKVLSMLEDGRTCTDVAQQLHAVEKAITNAKRTLIHDHIDHCLSPDADHPGPAEDFRAITKYL